MSKVLIIGQNGQVSQYLQAALSEKYDVTVSSRDELDLTNAATIKPFLEKISPSVIINPAAYTAVDVAEEEVELAFKINRDAVSEVAAYSAKTNTPLIHFSTDYVFAGNTKQAYFESDATGPNSVYGQSKLAGEQAIIESGAPALILRTAWVYSNKGGNFYKTMLRLAQSRSELSVVNDQLGSPTYAGSIAQASKEILEKVIAQGGIQSKQKGIYHLTCQGETTWCEFAKRIFELHDLTQISVVGILSSEYPTPAQRPAFSVLNGDKLQSVFGVRLPSWDDALQECVMQTKQVDANE